MTRGATPSKLKCPICKTSETEVKDSRGVEGGKFIRRRRMCVAGHKFTTREYVEEGTFAYNRRRERLYDTISVALSKLRAIS